MVCENLTLDGISGTHCAFTVFIREIPVYYMLIGVLIILIIPGIIRKCTQSSTKEK